MILGPREDRKVIMGKLGLKYLVGLVLLSWWAIIWAAPSQENDILSVAPFSEIVALNNTHIQLTKYSTSQVSAQGLKEDLAKIRASVENQVLWIDAPDSVVVTVAIPQLKRLRAESRSQVMGKLSGEIGPLILEASGQANVSLEGPVQLVKVLSVDNAHVQVWWVDAPTVEVLGSGNSQVMLSGEVKELTSHLFEQGQLEAQYLRAKHIQIRANQNAHARVLALDVLTAVAGNNSLIEYYKSPKLLNAFSGPYGNILEMGYWE